MILEAALDLLVEEGATAFTLRGIADRCGLKVGNVSRHFPRKEMLVQVFLDDLLHPEKRPIKGDIREMDMPPDEALALIISGSLDLIKTKKMTRLFTELWAMANHNEFVAERVEMIYRYVHELIESYVAKLNPALSSADVEVVALYISASIEGTTMLAGYDKPWSAKMPQLSAIAVKFLVDLAKTITPEEVRALSTHSS
jgi:AcrR family transcriptional regulator